MKVVDLQIQHVHYTHCFFFYIVADYLRRGTSMVGNLLKRENIEYMIWGSDDINLQN